VVAGNGGTSRFRALFACQLLAVHPWRAPWVIFLRVRRVHLGGVAIILFVLKWFLFACQPTSPDQPHHRGFLVNCSRQGAVVVVVVAVVVVVSELDPQVHNCARVSVLPRQRVGEAMVKTSWSRQMAHHPTKMTLPRPVTAPTLTAEATALTVTSTEVTWFFNDEVPVWFAKCDTYTDVRAVRRGP